MYSIILLFSSFPSNGDDVDGTVIIFLNPNFSYKRIAGTLLGETYNPMVVVFVQ